MTPPVLNSCVCIACVCVASPAVHRRRRPGRGMAGPDKERPAQVAGEGKGKDEPKGGGGQSFSSTLPHASLPARRPVTPCVSHAKSSRAKQLVLVVSGSVHFLYLGDTLDA